MPERRSVPDRDGPGAEDRTRLLEIRGVSKWYGGVKAVSEVSFDLRRGEILGIVGPNGAGKTSLVDVIAGVQPGDAGIVMIGDSHALSGIAPRARMGMSRTFQHPQLAGELTVAENVALGRLRSRGPSGWTGMFVWFLRALVRGGRHKIREGPEDLLRGRPGGASEDSEEATWTGLIPRELGGTEVEHVSYGIEKLSEVARAIVSRPDIILMDEPFAGLDGDSVKSACRVLERLASRGVGLLVVDHNIDILQDLCTRMIVLDQGEVIADGVPSVILENDAVRTAYFGETREHGGSGRS